MANSSRTTTQQNSDSQGGYRSLAGYVFQLLGSVSEAVELIRISPDSNVNIDLLTLEQFGQDSFVCLVPGTEQSRFTQYKHSLTDHDLQPGELREILDKFVVSLNLAGRKIESCDFVLATNRDPSSWTKNLLSMQKRHQEDPTAENSAALEGQLWKSCSGNRPDNNKSKSMLEILKKLIWQKIDEESIQNTIVSRANDLGVPKYDVDLNIQNTLGLFLKIVNSPTKRTISRRELEDSLAGHVNARSLRCEESRAEQRRFIEDALDRIHRKKAFVRREVVNEIVSAFLAFPLVLVVGDGGRGKSAGAWQSLIEQLGDKIEAPDFVTGRHISEFSETALINEFARWRNQVPDKDGNSIVKAIQRLEAGCRQPNLLVLYVDGIDEKEGKVSPYPANKRFIVQLLQQIVRECAYAHKKHISLVVSCRTVAEAEWLTSVIGEANIKTIPVEPFSDFELEDLALSLSDLPKNAILSMLSEDQRNQQRFDENANEEIIGPLREPRVWASFVDLDADAQFDYLSKSPLAQCKLASRYVHRIEEKAAERLGEGLGQHFLKSILEAAGQISLESETGICKLSQWVGICHNEGLKRYEANQLFDEFVTAGLFKMESDGGKLWSWKLLWLRDILCNQEEVQ